jgi:hypothetical protein
VGVLDSFAGVSLPYLSLNAPVTARPVHIWLQRRDQLRTVLGGMTHEVELSEPVLWCDFCVADLVLIQNQVGPNLLLLRAGARIYLLGILALGRRGKVEEVLLEVAQLLEEYIAIVGT